MQLDFVKLKEDVIAGLSDIKDGLKNSDREFAEKLNSAKNLLIHLSKRPNHLLQENYDVSEEKFSIGIDDFWLCQIDEITFVDKAPQKEGVENILGTFRGLRGFNFVYLILGDGQRIRFYLGVVKNKFSTNTSNFCVDDIGNNLLKPAIEGNFRGCKLHSVSEILSKENSTSEYDREKILNILRDPSFTAGIIEGIPSTDEQKNLSEGKKENFQGIDRLIDVMQGCKFGFAVIASPCASKDADKISRDLYEASDILSNLKTSTQKSHTTNFSFNDNALAGTNVQASDSSQKSDSDTFTFTEGTSSDFRQDSSTQISKSSGETVTDQSSHNKSYDYSRDCGNDGKDRETTHDSADVKNKSVQYTSGKNYNYVVSENKNRNENESKQHSDSIIHTTGKNNSVLKNNQLSSTETGAINFGTSQNLETEPKLSGDWLKYIDEILLPRLDSGNGKGIFNTCIYVFAENEISFRRLTSTAVSLFTGSTGNKNSMRSITFDKVKGGEVCKAAFKNLQIPAAKVKLSGSPYETLISRLTKKVDDAHEFIFCGNWLSTNELGLITNFPQREIVGLKLREEVEFGLNVESVPEDYAIKLGCLIQSGVEKKNIAINLDRRDLDKHTFISGVTGSGKTTTCKNILMECNLPFLVIEPAKTEYRTLQPNNTSAEIVYFTPGKQGVAPFFLNPFELFPGEEISARADMLTATFEASFEMEAAIPQIMSSAIYRAYRNKGWDISTSTWKNSEKDNPFADGVYAFPTLSDFKTAVKSVIDSQGFDERLRDEYLGSINARIESLMIGAKGQMLNTPRSVDFVDLVKRQVVIELEEIKSGSEKSLIMGLILTNLLQAVKQIKKLDKNFQHITLIGEAHRLLSRYMPGDSLNKKQGVEVFSDMLAEVRKYGESFIIADQIPDKMTPDVLKNTSTKIVHKLFAKDDKDAIGDTISLTDEQKNFLSNLQPGRAVVFSQGWDKSIQVKIENKNDSDLEDTDEEEIHRRSLNYYSMPEIARRGVVLGLDKIPAHDLTPEVAEKYLWLHRQSYTRLNELIALTEDVALEKKTGNDLFERQLDVVEGIREAQKKTDKNFFAEYISNRLREFISKPKAFSQETICLLDRLADNTDSAECVQFLREYISNISSKDICVFKGRNV